MPGYRVPLSVFKDRNRLNLDRYICSECELFLKDPVQLHCCEHRVCQSCADGLLVLAKCPREDCKKDFVQDNGTMVSPVVLVCLTR